MRQGLCRPSIGNKAWNPKCSEKFILFPGLPDSDANSPAVSNATSDSASSAQQSQQYQQPNSYDRGLAPDETVYQSIERDHPTNYGPPTDPVLQQHINAPIYPDPQVPCTLANPYYQSNTRSNKPQPPPSPQASLVFFPEGGSVFFLTQSTPRDPRLLGLHWSFPDPNDGPTLNPLLCQPLAQPPTAGTMLRPGAFGAPKNPQLMRPRPRLLPLDRRIRNMVYWIRTRLRGGIIRGLCRWRCWGWRGRGRSSVESC